MSVDHYAIPHLRDGVVAGGRLAFLDLEDPATWASCGARNSIPSWNAGATCGPLLQTPDRSERRRLFLMKEYRDDSGLHLRSPPLCKENFPQPEPSSASALSMPMQQVKHALTERPSEVAAASRIAPGPGPGGRYARSKAGWFSKQRSTPEYNREEHAWRFQYSYPPGMSPFEIMLEYNKICPPKCPPKRPVVVRPPKQKKSEEERNAIREIRKCVEREDSLQRVETALCKYNRANNTMFVLDEITAKCLFSEFGGPGYHYNFTAKPKNYHSADGNPTLFFAEMNCPVQSEADIMFCCIVGDKDAGHCHACEDYVPTMVHPSIQGYGGGNTTCIDYPFEVWSSSDSDYD